MGNPLPRMIRRTGSFLVFLFFARAALPLRSHWPDREWKSARRGEGTVDKVMQEMGKTVFMTERVRVGRLILGPFETNAYVLVCLKTRCSLLVDAPGEPERILSALSGTFPQGILMTHSHSDHVGALARLRLERRLPVAAHPEDASALPVPADSLLHDGDRIPCGALEIGVLHTPGHTPGSLCFHMEGLLFSGDTLFPGGPGRTGSPEDFRRILESLRTRIFPLPDDVRVFPGHGEGTVLSRERVLFQAFCARGYSPALCGDVVWEETP